MTFNEKLKESKKFAEDALKNSKDFALNKAGKAGELANKFAAKSKTISIEAKDLVLHKTLDTKKTAEVGFWSGLCSIVFGFPANVIAVVAGHTIEDRRRTANAGAYKVAAKALAPNADDLKKSRIGLAAGYFSIILTLITLGVLASKVKKAKEERD